MKVTYDVCGKCDLDDCDDSHRQCGVRQLAEGVPIDVMIARRILRKVRKESYLKHKLRMQTSYEKWYTNPEVKEKRKEYWKNYYLKNRDKKLLASNLRNQKD